MNITVVGPDGVTPIGTSAATPTTLALATSLAGSFPATATAVAAASGNVAAATATATLAANATKTNYLSGFEITGAGATGASVILATVTGTLGGTLTYVIAVPAGVAVGITPLVVEFNPPLPGSAVNTAIVVSAPSFGLGNTNAAVTAHGYVM